MAMQIHLRRSRSFLIPLIGLWLLMLCGYVAAQSSLKLYGQVTDSKGPVIGATVKIDKSLYTAITGQNGYYYIYDIPAGHYRLSCSFAASSPITLDCTIGTGPATRRDIYITNDVIVVAPVMVEADKPSTMNPANLNVKVYEIDHKGNVSAEQVLSQIPGVNLVKSAATGELFVSAGGIRPEGVNVLIDGRRLNSLLSGRVDLNQLPLAMVSRIEYYAPGGAVNAGDGGLGGTLNFVTTNNIRPELVDLRAAHGSFTSEDYAITLGNDFGGRGKFTGSWETGFARNEYRYTDNFGQGQIRHNAYAGYDKYYLSYDNRFLGNRLDISGFFYNGVNGVPGRINAETEVARSHRLSSSVGLDIFRIVGDCLKVSLKASFREQTARYRDFGSWIPYNTRYYERVVESSLGFELNLPGGITANQSYSATNGLLNGGDFISGRESLGKLRRDVYRVFSGLNAGWSIDRLMIKAGGSYSFNRVINQNYSSGSIGGSLTYDLHGRFGIMSAVSHTFRLPGLAELHWQEDVYVLPNPDLKPEESNAVTSELFSEFDMSGSWRISLEYQDIRYQDLIYWQRSQGLKYKPENVTKSVYFGVTLGIAYTSPGDYLTLDFSRVTSSSINHGEDNYGNFITFQPPYSNKLSLRLEYKNPYLKLEMIDVGWRYFLNANTKKLDPYTLVNLGCGFDLIYKRLRTSWAFEINNLTGAEYEYLEYQPMPPRNYNVTFNLKF
jgi:outer membrane cobalamin receptor